MNPATFLRCLGPEPWKTAYVEPVIRPLDGRYGENPYRFQHYFQYQVDPQAGARGRARPVLGLARGDRDRPARARPAPRRGRLGAADAGRVGARLGGLAATGMEITQFTYFQQLGGLDVELVPAEITYGLERLAMFLQGKRQRVRARVGAGGHLGRRLPRERARSGRSTTSRRRRSTCSCAASTSTRRSAAHLLERAAAAAGLRPGAEVLAHVQPARRARRDLRDRARGLHRARAQPRARGRAGLPRSCRRGADADAAA